MTKKVWSWADVPCETPEQREEYKNHAKAHTHKRRRVLGPETQEARTRRLERLREYHQRPEVQERSRERIQERLREQEHRRQMLAAGNA